MRINLFYFKKLRLVFILIFLLQFQFIKASETKSQEKQLSELWKSAIQNNRNRNHYAALELSLIHI